MTAFARTPVLAEATPLGALFRPVETYPRDPLCPLDVDSRRRLGAPSILGGGRIALIAFGGYDARSAFRAVCAP